MAVPKYSTKIRFPKRVILPMAVVRELKVNRIVMLNNAHHNIDDRVLEWLMNHEEYKEWFVNPPRGTRSTAKKPVAKKTRKPREKRATADKPASEVKPETTE